MTKHNTLEKIRAQSLGIAISQGSEFFNPQNSVYLQIHHLCQSFELSQLHIRLFLRGEAVSLLQHADLVNRFQDHFNFNVELFACSTALERYKENFHGPLQATYELTGLGFWVEEACHHPTLDFSSPAFMPKIIIATASPETTLFEEQLDLALATAAFDLEPVLLLKDAALHILDEKFSDTSIGKKMAAAEIYGISAVLPYESSQNILSEALAAARNKHRVFEVEITSCHKPDLLKLHTLKRETLYECDRFICM